MLGLAFTIFENRHHLTSTQLKLWYVLSSEYIDWTDCQKTSPHALCLIALDPLTEALPSPLVRLLTSRKRRLLSIKMPKVELDAHERVLHLIEGNGIGK